MTRFAALALPVLLALAACRNEPAVPPTPVAAPAAEATPSAPTAQAPSGADAGEAGRVIELSVTEDGFQPDPITVQAGEPVTLAITRKTEKTCATEIVLDEYGIDQRLPMGETVRVSFTPTQTGDLKYGCAMGKMIGGTIHVQ